MISLHPDKTGQLKLLLDELKDSFDEQNNYFSQVEIDDTLYICWPLISLCLDLAHSFFGVFSPKKLPTTPAECFDLFY